MTAFNVPEFLRNTNIYEVNLRQYTPAGTIQAFAKHIPRLRGMGVEVLWLMPIHPIGIKNRKGILGSYYSVRDFMDVNPEFGSKNDFKDLVDLVHNNGMKLIIDWVANHAAWDNVWTTTHAVFFVRDGSGNFKSPYDWSDVIQIDHECPEQQDMMINAMEYWVKEMGIDGFRADLAHLTPLAFWKRARKKTELIKPGLIWLGETEEPAYKEVFDITYAWAWMHATSGMFEESGPVSGLIGFLEEQNKILFARSLQLYFTTNHDENSWNGTEYEKYGLYAKALAVFCFTYRYSVPLIYSGQELPNYKRLQFFDKDEIEWTNDPALEDFYKILLTFHKKSFAGGDLNFLTSSSNILAYKRAKDEEEVLVFLNLGAVRAATEYSFAGNDHYRDVFNDQVIFPEKNMKINLEPGEYLVLTKQARA